MRPPHAQENTSHPQPTDFEVWGFYLNTSAQAIHTWRIYTHTPG